MNTYLRTFRLTSDVMIIGFLAVIGNLPFHQEDFRVRRCGVCAGMSAES